MVIQWAISGVDNKRSEISRDDQEKSCGVKLHGPSSHCRDPKPLGSGIYQQSFSRREKDGWN